MFSTCVYLRVRALKSKKSPKKARIPPEVLSGSLGVTPKASEINALELLSKSYLLSYATDDKDVPG